MTRTGKSNGMKAVAAVTAFFMMVMPAVPWNPSQNAYASAIYTYTAVVQEKEIPSEEEVSTESAPEPEPMMPVDIIDWANEESPLFIADQWDPEPVVADVSASSPRAPDPVPTPAGVPDSIAMWEARPCGGGATPSSFCFSPTSGGGNADEYNFETTPPSTNCSSSGPLDPKVCFPDEVLVGSNVNPTITLETGTTSATQYYEAATLDRVAGVFGYAKEDIIAIEKITLSWAAFP